MTTTGAEADTWYWCLRHKRGGIGLGELVPPEDRMGPYESRGGGRQLEGQGRRPQREVGGGGQGVGGRLSQGRVFRRGVGSTLVRRVTSSLPSAVRPPRKDDGRGHASEQVERGGAAAGGASGSGGGGADGCGVRPHHPLPPAGADTYANNFFPSHWGPNQYFTVPPENPYYRSIILIDNTGDPSLSVHIQTMAQIVNSLHIGYNANYPVILYYKDLWLAADQPCAVGPTQFSVICKDQTLGGSRVGHRARDGRHLERRPATTSSTPSGDSGRASSIPCPRATSSPWRCRS